MSELTPDTDNMIFPVFEDVSGETPNQVEEDEKNNICTQLFGNGGINSQVCLKLTMEQLGALKWAFDNKVFNPNDLSGSKTDKELIEVAKHFEQIHSVMDCLLELANKYGVYQRIDGRLNPEQTFKHIFNIMRQLLSDSDPSRSSKLFKTMKDARDSISDETFWKIPSGNGDERGGAIVQAVSEVSFLRLFCPEMDNMAPYQLVGSREKILEILDCLISIMQELYPRLKMFTKKDRQEYMLHILNGGLKKKYTKKRRMKSTKKRRIKSINNKKRKSIKKRR
jgi:hypothetical protein